MSSVRSVPFIDLKRVEPGFVEGFLSKVSTYIENTQFVGGPEVAQLEKNLSQVTGAAHTIPCANGTDALQVALRAAGIGKGDRVLIPDMTFWATFEAVVNVGATPYTVDVSLETLHVSLADLQLAVEKFKPKAFLLVHLYGWAAPDTLAMREFCKKQNVLLIEDCAQAINTQIEGKSLIETAWTSTTSFYPAKVLGASGDAGAVFSNDAGVAQLAKRLIDHGRLEHYSYGWVGWNSRMGVYEAGFLNASIPHLPARIESRRNVCEIYRKELGTKYPLAILSPAKDVWENGYCSVGMVDPEIRNKLRPFLTENGIGTGTIYPGAMSLQPGAKNDIGGNISNGNADRIARSVLNLPCFAYMHDNEIDYVISKVKEFFKK